MISLLGRLFIKNSNDVQNPLVRRAWGTLAAILGIILNLLLFAAKFLIGMLTGALSIQADAVNNLSDAGGSVVSLVSFKLSAKPADREHPFGHARIESRAQGIALDYTSGLEAYVSGISGLYSGEHGGTSGWMYSVDGETPNISCSSYVLSPGEAVVFYYSMTYQGGAQ